MATATIKLDVLPKLHVVHVWKIGGSRRYSQLTAWVNRNELEKFMLIPLQVLECWKGSIRSNHLAEKDAQYFIIFPLANA
jgi:hypothetical protein